MKYLDLFSGYGGFSLGIQQAYEKSFIIKKYERELLCQHCELDYAVWYTDNDVWNSVCEDDIHFLCIDCFIKYAKIKGINFNWEKIIDKNGIYNLRPNELAESEPEGGQCQFCAVYLFPLKSYLLSATSPTAEEIVNKLKEGKYEQKNRTTL